MSARQAHPALVVLAAGASERLGEPKALARLAAGTPGTPLEFLLAAGRALGDERALVVAGRDAAAIATALGRESDLVVNPDWSAGRTGSVQLAVRQRPERDLCLAPVDVPLVPAAVFAALAEEWARNARPARGWLAPCVRLPGAGVNGERRFGHPLIVGRELCRLLKSFPPDRPLRLLRELAEPLLALEVTSAAILDDLDSPGDLERLRIRLSRRD